MQELLDDIQKYIKVDWPMNKSIRNSINKALEKEKEQIKDAHCWGWSDAYDNLQHNKSRLCEEYYNQTYNQIK